MALEAVQAQAGGASIESRRILHLADDWVAAQYRKAAEAIDAQVFAGHLAGPGAPAGSRGDRAGPGGRQRDGATSRRGELEPALPQIAAAMHGYLTQIGCVLWPGGVSATPAAHRGRGSGEPKNARIID